MKCFGYRCVISVILSLCLDPGLFAATHFISDQLPDGGTLADYGLGDRSDGSADLAVRLVELATLPGDGQVQQLVSRGGIY